MALSPQELEVVKNLKKEGKSSQEIAGYIGGSRLGRPSSVGEPKSQEKPVEGFFSRAVADIPGDVAEGVAGIGKQFYKAGEKIEKDLSNEELSPFQKIKSTLGNLFKGGAGAVGEAALTVPKLAIPEQEEQDIATKTEEIATDIGEDLGNNPDVQRMIAEYEALPEDAKRDIDDAFGFAEGLATIGTAGLATKLTKPVFKSALETALIAAKKAKAVGTDVVDATIDATKAAAAATEKVADVPIVKAATRKTEEFGENMARAGERAREGAETAAARAERIKAAETPEEAAAIKNRIDDEFINGVKEADKPLLESYKQVLDTVEESPKGFGTKKNPAIVSGEKAAEQFDLIEKKRNEVGKAIGAEVKTLSKEQKVDMAPNVQKMNTILEQNGIKVPSLAGEGTETAAKNLDEGKGATKLDFSGTEYTKAERTRIQELYDLATEGGDSLTPNQIYRKDRLFGKLQREARLEGIADIIVNTTKEGGEEGTSSLFRLFRDVYSDQLDTISPEIKALNREYRKYSMMVDDIEDSIFKTPNFNITKSTNASEFAKVNLRRIFGEANSSPVYEAIADQMDTVARELGYAGASPKQVAAFTLAIRKLYPEAIPEAGLSGILKSGIIDTITSIAEVGKTTAKDQQKTLRALIESALKNAQ